MRLIKVAAGLLVVSVSSCWAYELSPSRHAEELHPYPHFSKRVEKSESGPLWGKDGPVIVDISQTSVPDCWFAAAMCACVKADKRFITSRVRLIGGMNVWEAEKVNVTVHNQRVEESIQTVSYEQVMAAPTDMSGKNWWPGAFQLATLAVRYPGQTGDKFGPSTAEVGLRIVAGFNTVLETNLKPDPMWEMLVRAPASPVLVGSNTETSILKTGHTYVTMETRVASNGTRMITLHNPFGKTEEYVFALIFSDINQIGHFDKWQKYGDPL